MDVAHVQKINNLALDLLKQGLAADKEDAIRQAENVFRTKSDGYQELRQTMSQVGQEVRQEMQTAEETLLGKREKSVLGNEQIQSILEQNSQFLVKTIKEFREKLAFMESELAALKSRQRELTQASAGADSIIASDKPAGNAAGAAREASAASEPHPRLGNYKQEDVSIEKFFNYGKK